MDRDVISANDELQKIKQSGRAGRKATGRGNQPRIAGDASPFFGLNQVLELVPVSRSGIYHMIARGEFPAAKKLGSRSAAWSKKEVRDWIDEKLK